MKFHFKFLLLFVLLVPTILIAQGVEIPDPSGLIVWLTPFIVLGATSLARFLAKSVSGAVTLLIVAVLSSLLPLITDYITGIDGNWLVQFALGLVSVFIHQFYKQLTTPKI